MVEEVDRGEGGVDVVIGISESWEYQCKVEFTSCYELLYMNEWTTEIHCVLQLFALSLIDVRGSDP